MNIEIIATLRESIFTELLSPDMYGIYSLFT